jgi:hypothetical protein
MLSRAASSSFMASNSAFLAFFSCHLLLIIVMDGSRSEQDFIQALRGFAGSNDEMLEGGGSDDGCNSHCEHLVRTRKYVHFLPTRKGEKLGQKRLVGQRLAAVRSVT